jgi:hypothetical protein
VDSSFFNITILTMASQVPTELTEIPASGLSLILPLKGGSKIESQREALVKRSLHPIKKTMESRRVGASVDRIKTDKRERGSTSPQKQLNPSLRSKSITPLDNPKIRSTKATLQGFGSSVPKTPSIIPIKETFPNRSPARPTTSVIQVPSKHSPSESIQTPLKAPLRVS